MKRVAKSWLLASLLFFFTGSSILILVFIKKSVSALPSVDTLESYVPPLVTKVLDMHGLQVGEFFIERRTTVPLTKIPVDLRQAVMATEDSEFLNHWGVDPQGIMRAVLANLKAGRVVQGGSTLTQQLAKTIFLTREKTLIRKFKELLLTLQIEYRYSKEEILELYLNQIYFGAGSYGVQSAAQLYFDKKTEELTLPECALLAGLVRSPNRYSPLRNPELAQSRRALVLNLMKQNGFISESEEEEALKAPLIPEGLTQKPRQAHYFLEEIRKDLGPKLGEDQLEQGGYTIQTTLDLNMQRAAKEVLDRHLSHYDLNYGTATLKEYNQALLENTTEQIEISTVPPNIQGALIAMDVHTGAIRAMVGGRDFQTSQFNRAIQAKRQPGSAFKPFVWAAALEGRFTAATVIDDYPLVYIDMESDPTLLAEATSYTDIWRAILDNLQMTEEEWKALNKKAKLQKKGKLKKEEELAEEQMPDEILKRYWRPQNYDGRHLGPITLRRALQKSRNLVSIRIIDSVGPRPVVKLANKAGIKSRLSPVLSLALGTSVMSLLELTNAFATFANGGLHAEPYFIERISDRRGRTLLEISPQIEAALNPQTAFLITNLLQGVVNHGTGWYAKRLRRPLGGKTGTTQDQRDVLFIGFSPDLACGVWVGYDDFRPLKKGLSASSIAAPLWTDFMREALKNTPKKEFPIPSGIEFAKVDTETGYLALPTCPKVNLEAFRKGTIPTEFCPYEHDLDPDS